MKVLVGFIIFSSMNLAFALELREAPSLKFKAGNREVEFSFKEMTQISKPETVSLNDPTYKKNKTYDGFVLRSLLEAAQEKLKIQPGEFDEIVFEAADGYAPSASFSSLEAARGIVTFQEHGKVFEFEEVDQGKQKVKANPFYVVWPGIRSELEHLVPWSYQLVKIEWVKFEMRYPKIYPRPRPGVSAGSTAFKKVSNGFRVFKDQCMRCHSVNGQGGELGPELNIPKNVSEYFAPHHLAPFIMDSSQYRLRSKMPPFKGVVSATDVSDVVKYLTHMKGQKEPPSAK